MDTHTNAYTDDLHRINFRKAGAHRPVAGTPDLKISSYSKTHNNGDQRNKAKSALYAYKTKRV